MPLVPLMRLSFTVVETTTGNRLHVALQQRPPAALWRPQHTSKPVARAHMTLFPHNSNTCTRDFAATVKEVCNVSLVFASVLDTPNVP